MMNSVSEPMQEAVSVSEDLTDIHIKCSDPSQSLIFPGPHRPETESEKEIIKTIIERAAAVNKKDFMVTVDGLFFRGRRDGQVVDGEWLRMRRMASVPPTLDTLPSPLPGGVKSMLMSPTLAAGGLVYVIGAPGAGKTTTSSATLVSRLLAYGGYAYTVEDPPEMPLNGWHTDGYCAQTWVAGDNSAEWQEALRGVLRSQPAGTPCILYLGEVRDTNSAAAMLRAASSGFLVIATGFGTDIPSAIDTLARLAVGEGDPKAVQDSLASILRMVVHQRLTPDGKLVVRMLASVIGRTPVANKIRNGLTAHLEGDVQFQANQLMMGVDVFSEQLKKTA